MNLIKNFFHAFGDIILGLFVVGIAVFLIGTQINNDFDVFALGTKAYDKVMTKISGEEPADLPAEILSDPGDNNVSDNDIDVTDTQEGSKVITGDENVTPVENTPTDDTNKDGVPTENTPTDDTNKDSNPGGEDNNPIKPEAVPAIRNITISNGSTADQVASGLFTNGIIGTKEEFLAEYARLSVGRSIISGTFEIPTGSTPAEVLAIIAP